MGPPSAYFRYPPYVVETLWPEASKYNRSLKPFRTQAEISARAEIRHVITPLKFFFFFFFAYNKFMRF